MKNIFISLSVFVLLAGCQSQPVDLANLENLKKTENYATEDFSFDYPNEAIYKFSRGDGSIAFSTTQKSPQFYELNDFSFSIHQPSALCNPLITGAFQTSEIINTNGNTTWGKIDIWDPGPGGGPDRSKVICQPGEPKRNMYMMCSEKDDKAVLICLYQVTNNPQLAEQIFSTFRWTN